MPFESKGLHHFHRRKRIYEKHEPYPHPNKWKRLMDKMIYLVGIIVPLMTIPQVLKVWIEKSAAGISIAAWSAYSIASFFWIIYGIMHKEYPIIFTSALLFVLDSLVVVGALVYL